MPWKLFFYAWTVKLLKLHLKARSLGLDLWFSVICQCCISMLSKYSIETGNNWHLWPRIEEQTWNVHLWNKHWVLPCSQTGHQPPRPFIPHLSTSTLCKGFISLQIPTCVVTGLCTQEYLQIPSRIILSQLLITLFSLHHIKNYQFDALS